MSRKFCILQKNHRICFFRQSGGFQVFFTEVECRFDNLGRFGIGFDGFSHCLFQIVLFQILENGNFYFASFANVCFALCYTWASKCFVTGLCFICSSTVERNSWALFSIVHAGCKYGRYICYTPAYLLHLYISLEEFTDLLHSFNCSSSSIVAPSEIIFSDLITSFPLALRLCVKLFVVYTTLLDNLFAFIFDCSTVFFSTRCCDEFSYTHLLNLEY